MSVRSTSSDQLISPNDDALSLRRTVLTSAVWPMLEQYGARFDKDSDTFSFDSAENYRTVVSALERMERDRVLPRTFHSHSLESWLPSLGATAVYKPFVEGAQPTSALHFEKDTGFLSALNALDAIESTVRLAPEEMITDPNVVFAKDQLRRLGLLTVEAHEGRSGGYLPANETARVKIEQVLAQAGTITPMQIKTLDVARELLGDERAAQIVGEPQDRFKATIAVAQAQQVLGEALGTALRAKYPEVIEEQERQNVALRQRAPEINTRDIDTRDPRAQRDSNIAKAYFWNVPPVGKDSRKHDAALAIGKVLADIDHAGEYKLSRWRMAEPGEMITGPILAINAEWIAQSNGKQKPGEVVLHDRYWFKRSKLTPMQDGKPVTMGMQTNRKPFVDRIEPVRTSTRPYQSTRETIRIERAARNAEREMFRTWKNDARQAALADARETLANLPNVNPNLMTDRVPSPKPSTLPYRGTVIGASPNGEALVIHYADASNRAPQVHVIEGASLQPAAIERDPIRKGDTVEYFVEGGYGTTSRAVNNQVVTTDPGFRYGMHERAEELIFTNVRRIPSNEATIETEIARATASLDASGEHVPHENTVAHFADRYHEWMLSRCGWAPNERPHIMEAAYGQTYTGPIYAIRGNYAAQFAGLDHLGVPQIVVHPTTIFGNDERHLRTNQDLSIVYDRTLQSSPVGRVLSSQPLIDAGIVAEDTLIKALEREDPIRASAIKKMMAQGPGEMSQAEWANAVLQYAAATPGFAGRGNSRGVESQVGTLSTTTPPVAPATVTAPPVRSTARSR
jgi:hypothetical protein